MGANLTPHWGLIIFLVVVYAISALLHLDPIIINPGGASAISGITITAFDLKGFLYVLVAALLSAALATVVFHSNWVGAFAFVFEIVVCSIVLNTWQVFIFLGSVVTFSDLGLPLVVQFVIALPCTIILTWTAMAFVSAILGIGGSISNG